jgi:RNA polymerase sigma-70 factor, ECF subfamily
MRDDIQRAKHGDRDALNRVLSSAEDRLRRLAHSRLGPDLKRRVHTSDILQSTYLDVIQAVTTFAGDDLDDFVTWVGRLLENNIRDKRRFLDAMKRTTARQETPPDGSLVARLGFERATPSAEVAFNEDLFLFARALDHLTPDQRQVITLRKIKEESFAQVAETMGRSEEATRKLLSRALTALVLEMDRLQGTPRPSSETPHES